MTIGIGSALPEEALSDLCNMSENAHPIPLSEYQQRIEKAQFLMRKSDIQVTYLNAGTNLYYFTGTRWHPSERLVGALLPAEGAICYLAPDFEVDTLKSFVKIEGEIFSWHEHESPYELVMDCLQQMGIHEGRIGIDESTPFFVFDGLSKASSQHQFVDAKMITAGCRMQKSANELALMQLAKNMTLAVQKAVAKVLKPGITTTEVESFIDCAHQKVGATGSSFCIALFGQDSAFPHGVKTPKPLELNDMVLIDTGCLVQGYQSDITRSYVFGKATPRQREMWTIEKEAQACAFDAATLGIPCGQVDIAVRTYLQSKELGPEYQVPGLPHRTGHGIGLDIHEWPYLVSNEETLLAPGMCFSNEPMLVLPGEFGIRLEDHFYMTDSGPSWFTQPAYSIDNPFGH